MAGDPVWLPGFFTGRRHAVTDPTDRMIFHSVALTWSVCRRATVLVPDAAAAEGPRCDRCVYLLGPNALR